VVTSAPPTPRRMGRAASWCTWTRHRREGRSRHRLPAPVSRNAENRTYLQIVPLTDRLDYVVDVRELAYCRTVERLAGIRVPERAEYLRVIVCELQRIASHIWASGPPRRTPVRSDVHLRVRPARTRHRAVRGAVRARLTYNYVRPGGVSFDAPRLVRPCLGVHGQGSTGCLPRGLAVLRQRHHPCAPEGSGLSAEDAVAWALQPRSSR